MGSSRRKKGYAVLSICAIVFAIILIVVSFIFQPVRERKVERINFEGTFTTEEGTFEFGGEKRIDEDASEVTLNGHVLEMLDEHYFWMLYISNVYVQIYVNDDLIYDNKESYDSFHASVEYWADVELPQNITPSDNIQIHMQKNGNTDYPKIQPYKLLITNMFLGTKQDLLNKLIVSNLFSFFVSILVEIVGLVCLFANFFIIHQKKDTFQMGILLSIIFILGGIWIYFQQSYTSLIFFNPFLENVILNLTFLLLLIFFLLLIYTYFNVKILSLDVNICVLFLYFVVMLSGYIFNDQDLINFTFFTDIFAFLTIINVVITLLKVMKRKKVHSDLDSLIALTFTLFVLCVFRVLSNTLTSYVRSLPFEIAIIIFVIIESITLVKKIRREQKLIEKALEMEQALRKTQNEVILSQIKPHFLFNFLNVIRGLIMFDIDKADDAIVLFSNYLRQTIFSIESNGYYSFKNEMEASKDFIKLENILHNNCITYSTHFEYTDFILPSFVIEPILHNAMKHGILNKDDGKGHIIFSTKLVDDYVYLIIQDDGVGFDVNQPLQGENYKKQTGLKNVKERLKNSCNGILKIESVINQGTIVTIIIPKDYGRTV